MSEPNPDYAKVSEGQIVMLSEGEYSDYGVRALYRALRSFDMAAEAAAFKASSELEPYALRDGFLTHLESAGFVQDVEHREIHIGSYGELEIGRY